MVEHQIIYSPERKKNNGYIMNAMNHFFEAIQFSRVTILKGHLCIFELNYKDFSLSFTWDTYWLVKNENTVSLFEGK
jgi:hypothetical protein